MVKKMEGLEDALLKVAHGFTACEVTEEYSEVEGKMRLIKRKKIKKEVPPDLKAVQILLAEKQEGVSSMTDEELEAEKKRLLAVIEKAKEGVEKKGKTATKPKKKINE